MQNQNRLDVDIIPQGGDIWRTLGTEYEKSFTAIKEIFDNSVSRADNEGVKCKINISLRELENGLVKISIEDISGGVEDVNLLLKLSSDSNQKNGTHNIYGLGLKNSLAYFNKDHLTSNWRVESRTKTLLDEGKILVVNAPYLYNGEYNEKYEHFGMNVSHISDEFFSGIEEKPGTIISFETEKNVLAKMNPLKGSGAPSTLLKTISQDLVDLISLYYQPLFLSQKLEVSLNFKELNDYESTLLVKTDFFPYKELISAKEYKTKIPIRNAGFMEVKAQWLLLNRNTDHPFIYPQKNGLVCYINGILADPFCWVEQVFGDLSNHPSLNSVICLVEVNGPKNCVPELSVSKTKFQINGENYQKLIQFLQTNCPKNEISYISKNNNTENESVLRDRHFKQLEDMYRRQGLINFLYKEHACLLHNKEKAGDSLRYDIIYQMKHTGTIHLKEFKKDTIRPESVAQIIQYGELVKEEYPNCEIELELVAKKASDTAKKLIEFYQMKGWNLKFNTFVDLNIPGAKI
jgi:hypothetical protein